MPPRRSTYARAALRLMLGPAPPRPPTPATPTPAPQICMCGDRLDTDVLLGKNGGLTTMLVLSGVTTEEQLLADANTIHPDCYMDSLAGLLEVNSLQGVAA